MEHIRSLMPKVLNKRGLHKHAQAAHFCWTFQEWFSDNHQDIALYLKVVSFNNGIVSIVSEHSCASQECRDNLAELKIYLKSSMPDIHIEDIRIVRS